MKSKNKIFWLTYIYLLVLVLIRFIPIIFPGSRSWGFNHLIFLPDIYSYCFFTVAFIALIIPFLKFSEKTGESIADWFSDKFLDGKQRYLYRFLFIAVMTSLFIIFTAPTHFLGDGYDVINNIAAQSGVHVKWSEIGITKLLVFMTSILDSDTINGSLLSFQIVSIISGAVTINFILLISRVVSEDRIKRYLVFVMLILSGVLLLFFGYTEYYPIIWIFMTGFFYYSLRFQKESKGLILAWLFLLIGIFLHVQLIIFLPALLFLSFGHGRGLNIYHRYKSVLWSLAGITILVSTSFLAYKYTTNLYVEDTFLPLFFGKPVYPEYAILSVPHLLDIFNQFILISPMLFLLLFINSANLKNILKNKTAIFLGLGALGSLLFLFVIDPKLAFPRDWDLFSISGFSLMLFSVILIKNNSIQHIGKLIISMMLILSIYSVPFLLTNLHVDRSEKYIESLIELDKSKSISSMTVLSRYYKDNNEREKFDSLMAKFNSEFLQERIISQTIDATLAGDLKLANKYIQLIKPDKFSGEYQRLIALINLGSGRYDKALYHINGAIQLRKYASGYHWTRSRIYYSMKKYDSSLSSLRESKKLDPSSLKTVDAMAMIFDLKNRPDSCVYYAKKTLEIDSTRFTSYVYIIKWLARAGQIKKAERYISMYSRYSPVDSVQQENIVLLDSLIANKGR